MVVWYGSFGLAAAATVIAGANARFGSNRNVSETAGPLPAKVSDLAFMAGSWLGTGLGGRVEEHWTADDGDSMIGMFRLVGKGDKLTVCELMIVEQEGDRVVYRFRHFGPRHKPWEPPDAPLVFDLVKLGENEAVFDSSVQTDPKRLTYRRVGPDRLTILVQGEKDGALTRGFTLSLRKGRLGE